MTVEKLERVMWRLRAIDPNNRYPSVHNLRRAIMLEIGTDNRTYHANKQALKRLGWIKAKGTKRVELTGIDLTDS